MFSAVHVVGAVRGSGRKMIVVALTVLILAFPLGGNEPPKKAPEEGPKKPKTLSGVMVVRFCDNSSLKMTLREEAIEITTRYGKLRIPVADVQQIDFANRISADVLKRIEAAISNLGHADFDTREAAEVELLGYAEQAYHLLLKAVKSSDAEVAKRATALVEKIREALPEDLLEFRPHDVIQVSDTSKFVGRIEGLAFKASTTAFGEVPLKLACVRGLRSWNGEPEIDLAKLPFAPGSMNLQAGLIGKTFVYRVTGANAGGIYGTDVYTADSHLATVAVHAGIVKVGETGLIKVTIVPSPAGYVGSTRNGVTSSEYGAYQGAYKVSK